MDKGEIPNNSLEKRRIHALYSCQDFQIALSAADFLSECDTEKTYNKIDIRRFKCYETTAIISYSRPFTQSKDGFPCLSLKKIGEDFTDAEKALHKEIITMRNKIYAHSDAEYMRIASETYTLPLQEDNDFYALDLTFDEGLRFIGYPENHNLITLIRKAFKATYLPLLRDAQNKPELYNFKKDYLETDG